MVDVAFSSTAGLVVEVDFLVVDLRVVDLDVVVCLVVVVLAVVDLLVVAGCLVVVDFVFLSVENAIKILHLIELIK